MSFLAHIPNARSAPKLSPNSLRAHLSQSHPTPLHIPGLVSHWKASSWKLPLIELREAIGEDKEVEVEFGPRGRGYLDKDYKRVSIGFGLFLDAFILDKIPNTSPNLTIAYLAQSDIDNPELLKAMPELEHFSCGPRGQNFRRALWIGPDGTFTPFHKDPYIGLYIHLIGRKRFFLLPPDARQYLDISPNPPYTNTSQIPLPVTRLLSDTPSEDVPPDILDRYRRLLLEAIKMNSACQVGLNAGESVLIPEGWWHSAEGVGGPGLGVNAWFR